MTVNSTAIKKLVLPLVVTLAGAWCQWVSKTLVSQTADLAVIKSKLVEVTNHLELKKEASIKMGMKSMLVHYRNKYPTSQVHVTESSLDVYKDGELLVSLRKNGAGQLIDAKESTGARDAHDLSPIPVESRYLKLYKDGSVKPAEEYAERFPKAKSLAEKHHGRVPSIEELAKVKHAKS